MRVLKAPDLTVEEREPGPEEPGEAAGHRALEDHKVIAGAWDKQVDRVKVAVAHKDLAPERTVEAFPGERVAVAIRLAAEMEPAHRLVPGDKAAVETARSGVVAATRAALKVAVEEGTLPLAAQAEVITAPGVGACSGLIGCRPVYPDGGSSYPRDFLAEL